jgi:hypothetical protein
MTDLHVIYRLEQPAKPGEPEHWATYSYPIPIYVSGTNIESVRSAFREAVEFAFGEDTQEYQLVEHLERPLVDGAYVRTAVDRRYLDRAQTAQAFERTLSDRAQRTDFARTAPMSGSGDTVVVAVTGNDRLGWLMEQMNDHDSLVVCLLGPGDMVWWSYIAGQHAELANLRTGSTLADDGLDADSTVSELITKDSSHAGRLVSAAS